jgi:hypothetical protein
MIAGDQMRNRWMNLRAQWAQWALRAMSLAAILILPRSADGQTTRGGIEVFGGYSYLRDPGNSVLAETASDDVYALGWFAGVADRIWRRVDLVGEIGGQYKSGVTLEEDATFSLHTFLGGPGASIQWGPAALFAQVLAGVTYARATAFDTTVSTTKLTLQGGGGVDYSVTTHLATRVQIDYRVIPPHGGLALTNQFRVAAGLVYR